MSCNTGNGVTLAVAFTKTATGGTDAGQLTALGGLVDAFDVQSMGAWDVSVDVFDSPLVSDPVGAFVRKCFGDRRNHGTFSATILHDTAVDLASTVGARGTITVTYADGSSWSGTGAIVSAQAMADADGASEMTSTVALSFDGVTGPVHATTP